MNGQQLAPMTVGFAIAVVLILVIGFFRRKRNMIAHLAPVTAMHHHVRQPLHFFRETFR